MSGRGRDAWALTAVGPTPAFDRLSPADRKIARGIWEAQIAGEGEFLTLDEIAAMRRRGRPWGAIVRDLKRAGRLAPAPRTAGTGR